MADEQPKRSATVTREDLYKQVWETPMSRLAADYGISGNGLAKICDRLKIPYPPRGYWAKKAAGKKVIEFRLPDAKDDTPTEVTISPTPPPAPPPHLPKEVEEKLSAARERTKNVTFPERLGRPHAIIASWIDERKRQREDAKRDPWRTHRLSELNFTEMDHRRHRILDTLFKTLEQHGFKVKLGDRHEVYFEIERERVDFKLREKQRQVRRPLTESEKSYGLWRERGWMQELQPSGIFVLTLETRLIDGAKHEWRDGNQSLEAQLPDIISLLLLAGPILKERRRAHEEAQKRHYEEERRRSEEKEQRKTDQNQWRRFVDIAGHWREREIARQFLAALEAGGISSKVMIEGKSLADWIAWAHAHVESSDLLKIGAARIFADIGAVKSWTYRD